jgi:D-beta-D-heptose 7-phosphate kinase/D-beta-D-heptose 1-phosphate adenosyltransferase
MCFTFVRDSWYSSLHMAKKKTVAKKKTISKKARVSQKKRVLKKKSVPTKKKPVVVAVSGGFDPVHIGHVRMLNEAKALGDKLVVILNNDHWIRKKKGQEFMPDYERKEILESFGAVDEVFLTEHGPNPTDMSVCDALRKVRPHIFANGGDRHADNVPEVAVCRDINCQMVYSIGKGGKVQSSSWLLARHEEQKMKLAIQDTLKRAMRKRK